MKEEEEEEEEKKVNNWREGEGARNHGAVLHRTAEAAGEMDQEIRQRRPCR